MDEFNNDKKIQNLRIIKTARDIESINNAVEDGFIPLFRKVEPSKEIRSKYAIYRNKKTGLFEHFEDYRAIGRHSEEYEEIIDWTFYYPFNFTSPFAAYLIPKDIAMGERVMLEDLIEDYVYLTWNQGDVFRLERCEAVWDGSNLDIQYNEDEDELRFIIG
jgi:hypothetical protein